MGNSSGGGISVFTRDGTFERWIEFPYGISALGADDVGGDTESDFYRIAADGSKTIEIEVSLPAAKAGEFTNNLDPIVRLFDSAGDPVASNDNGGADGRSARLSYKVPRNGGGTFYIEVTASPLTEKPTRGEYILSVKGTRADVADPFTVVDTDPANASSVYRAPQQFEVSFNDTVLLPTLQGSDFLLNGNPAHAVVADDGDTVTFQNALAFQWAAAQGGNGHYYVLTSTAKGWIDAQAEAAALGGNLVTVNDQAEQNYLKRVFFSGPDRFRSFWMGMNDLDQEGVYVWASGEPVTYTNWTPPYQPDNYGPGEDGGQINWDAYYNNGGWNDLWIDQQLFGIIELTSLPTGFALANEGLNTFTVVGGSINDIQATAVTAYVGTFILDTTPPVVTAVTPTQGAVIGQSDVTVTVAFSESMETDLVNSYYVPLSGQISGFDYYPSGLSWNEDATVLTLTYGELPEDAYTLRLVGTDGVFEDASVGLDLDGDGDGVEGGEYTLTFFVDAGTRALPTPLVPVNPVGTQVYTTPYTATGVLAPAGDTDDWTIELEAGQTLTIILGSSFDLVGSIELYNPDGSLLANATGASAGAAIILQTVPLAETGTYTLHLGAPARWAPTRSTPSSTPPSRRSRTAVLATTTRPPPSPSPTASSRWLVAATEALSSAAPMAPAATRFRPSPSASSISARPAQQSSKATTTIPGTWDPRSLMASPSPSTD